MQSKEALDCGLLDKPLVRELSACNKLGADTASAATIHTCNASMRCSITYLLCLLEMSCLCQCRQCKLCNQPGLLQPLHAMQASISEGAEATRRRQAHQVCIIRLCNCLEAYILMRSTWQNPSSFAKLRWWCRCVAGMNRARIVGRHAERY